jgi:hypothetical protein
MDLPCYLVRMNKAWQNPDRRIARPASCTDYPSGMASRGGRQAVTPESAGGLQQKLS